MEVVRLVGGRHLFHELFFFRFRRLVAFGVGMEYFHEGEVERAQALLRGFLGLPLALFFRQLLLRLIPLRMPLLGLGISHGFLQHLAYRLRSPAQDFPVYVDAEMLADRLARASVISLSCSSGSLSKTGIVPADEELLGLLFRGRYD